MMSTTARYPIKPKTFTLLELCQSFSDFRRPPASASSYQSSSNTAQILTRRLYLHPLTVNPNPKPQLPKISNTAITSPDHEQRPQLSSDKNRDIHHTKIKSSYSGLAVLSSSFPLTPRINSKPDTRHFRDKASIHTDDEIISDYDVSTTTISFNQPSLPSITRGTFSSTHTKCTRPSHMMNHQKTYRKPNRLEKVNVWNHLDRRLQRPIPIDLSMTPIDLPPRRLDPPTTPMYSPPTPLNLPTPVLYPTRSPPTPLNLPRRVLYPTKSPPTPLNLPRTVLNSAISPLDPPITPFGNVSDFNLDNDESPDQYLNHNSIQEIQIYKRNAAHRSFIDEDNDYDDYISYVK